MQPLQAGDPAWVGRYQLLARLGAGGMGTVFLARSPGARLAALKLVRSEFAADEGFRARFRREIAAARRVSGLYTAPVLDADADASLPWFAAGYVAAPTLAEAVTAIGPMPEAALRALGAGLVEALLAIHAAGLIHRDLKPGNILLAEDGPKVIDFGITKAIDASQLTGTGGAVGTPAYMSPEQITASRDVGPASDVFSLAGVLVYAATGVGPFGAGDSASLLYQVMYGEPRLDGVPAPLRGLLAACLDKEPAERPEPSAVLDAFTPSDPGALISPALRREVAAREAAAAAVSSGPVTPPPPLPRVDETAAGDPSRRRVLRLAAAAAVGVVGAGGGATAWALTRKSAKPVKPAPHASGLVPAPASAWALSWPAEFADRLELSVSVAGGTVVWRGNKGFCGVDAASGRRLWTLSRPTGDIFTPGYRVFGSTVFGLGARDTSQSNMIYIIDPATGAARSIELPGDITNLTDAYGMIGTTVFVGANVDHTGKQMIVLAVDMGSGRVLWRFPSNAQVIDGVADSDSVYIITPSKIFGIDAVTGARRWVSTWFTGNGRSTAYPLTLGNGLLFFCATGDSSFQAVSTRDGAVAWKKSDFLQRPVLPLGSAVITVGQTGFYAYDQATGALRWQRTSSPTALDYLVADASDSGSSRLLVASFSDGRDSAGTSNNSGFFVAGTAGGPSWAHWGPSYNDGGWGLAVSGSTIYATDNRQLYCFRGGT
ncbi:PQQ-binding-like beta-propeller repeat protein [Actinoallomurus sp. NPDC050550]|uniref:serine/threonine-protein kinase n=1 Tax=Actinoallomurus sp. NPDC050550 TaxID=3154937 RepID=UPI0033F0AFF7